MKKHLDFKTDIFFYLSVALLLLMAPFSLFLPVKFGYENGVFENIQMVILLLSCVFAWRSKEHKKFFNFVLMVIIILILREVNCGRSLFFPIPGEENAFYSWKEIPYGWLAHPLYGIYIAITVIYGLIHKFWIDLSYFLTKTKLPVWNMVALSLGIVLGLAAEKATNNYVFEECAELLLYVGLCGIIYCYAAKKYKSAE